jgi:hypothetical protein
VNLAHVRRIGSNPGEGKPNEIKGFLRWHRQCFKRGEWR